MDSKTRHLRLRLLVLLVAVLGLAEGLPAVRADAASAQVHTVRRGDTLGRISRTYGVSERQLRTINSLENADRLRPGSRIVVRAELPESYVVRKGDTLAKIGRRFGLAPGEISERNQLESDAIGPGQELKLRGQPREPGPSAETRRPTEQELEEAARPRPTDGVDNTAESLQTRVLRVAQKMLFLPYRWGGTTLRGIDCSAYVRLVFSFLDLQLPRSVREQFRIGENVERSELSMGDLVFFRTYAKYPSHVGIYLGDNRFIHASSGSREVTISSLDMPYYVKRYIGARRLLFGQNDVEN